tara:strand:+ start:244 stop:582 length:339 start_codon:yes stop_codon:yes gene_type:complete
MNAADWNIHNLQIPNNETIDKDNFTCTVVDGKGTDNIFQFFNVKIDDFDEVLAETIEDHFGNTEGYALEFVSEMSMYGLLAKNQRDNPLFNKEFYVDQFLDLLDKTITELQN